VIVRQVHLRGHYNRRFYRKPRLLVADDHRWRRDLFHGSLGHSPLWSWQRIVIASTASATHQFLRRRQSVSVRGRRNQYHILVRRDLLHDLMAKQRASQKQANQRDVDDSGDYDPVSAVIVVLTPNLLRATSNLGADLRAERANRVLVTISGHGCGNEIEY
jgi:hypothetical protein